MSLRTSLSPLPAILLLGAALLASGCAQRPQSRANAAAVAACRAETDRVYAAQNRVDLSLRDNRDTPFASSYNSGITSRGLSAQYARDNMTQSCVAQATDGRGNAPAAPAASTGPVFSASPTATAR